MATVRNVVELLESKGDSQYGREAVSQLEHALQAAALAEGEGAAPALIAAALLHDVGHLLHDLPIDAPDDGVDDHHETSSVNFLKRSFPAAVYEPIRLHVAAKRYLCTVEPAYFDHLSPPSVVSLSLQGGRMTPAEVADFEAQPYFSDAVRLRRWDDTAKVAGLRTPPLTHFAEYLIKVTLSGSNS
ncbi:MAG TPA: HD domain-containing protein [Fimbriiglobus sp.]